MVQGAIVQEKVEVEQSYDTFQLIFSKDDSPTLLRFGKRNNGGARYVKFWQFNANIFLVRGGGGHELYIYI